MSAAADPTAVTATTDSKPSKGQRHNTVNCDYCRRDITSLVHIKCATCTDFELCLDCFSMGIEVEPHIKTHPYRVISAVTTPLFEPEWGADEELVMLDGIEQFGFGNWHDIAELIGNGKTKHKVEQHYNECYVFSRAATPFMPDVDHTLNDGFPYVKNYVPLSDSEVKYRQSQQQSNALNQFATQAKHQALNLLDPTTAPSPSPSPTPSTPAGGNGETEKSNAGGVDGHKVPSAQAMVAAGFAIPTSTTTDSLSSLQQTNVTPAAKRRMSKVGGRASSGRGAGGLVGSQAVKPPKARGKGLLVGWQEKRGDFDTEYENNAELIIADLEFNDADSERDKAIKLDVLTVYNSVLDERAERKRFILERGLLERREKKRSKHERDVYNALRPFARFQSAEQHEQFVQGVLKEKYIRQRIEQLQHYRAMGITTLGEAELYEAEKRKRDAALTMKAQARNAYDGGKRPNMGKRGAGMADVDMTAVQSSSNKSSLHDAAKSIKQQSGNDESSEPEFDCTTMDGAKDLKGMEVELCNMMHLEPLHWLQIKDKINGELHNRDLYRQGTGHKLLRVEINKQDRVLDFVIEAGWLNVADTFGATTGPYDLDVRDENGRLRSNDTAMKT